MSNKKGFNYGLYAVIAFILVAVILSVSTVATFKSKYLAFTPEKIATNYVDSIAQSGDGYNAYKYTIVSKSDKYGDFVRKNYIYPVIWPGYTTELSDEELDQIKETKGLDNEDLKNEKDTNDDGTLSGQVIDKMYPYYVSLVKQYTWDNYDSIYTKYISQLQKVRTEVFGDTYLDDEIVFTALESNVATYGDNLAGAEAVYDENATDENGDPLLLSEAVTGAYQKAYGDDYKLTTNVTGTESLETEEFVANMNEDTLAKYGISKDDISAVSKVTLDVILTTGDAAIEDGKTVATATVIAVQIGNTWYVDNEATDTTELYAIQTGVSAK